MRRFISLVTASLLAACGAPPERMDLVDTEHLPFGDSAYVITNHYVHDTSVNALFPNDDAPETWLTLLARLNDDGRERVTLYEGNRPVCSFVRVADTEGAWSPADYNGLFEGSPFDCSTLPFTVETKVNEWYQLGRE